MPAGWMSAETTASLFSLTCAICLAKCRWYLCADHKEAHEVAGKLRSEWVVEIVGKVNKRPEKMVNKDEPSRRH